MMFYKETEFKETPIGKIPKEWELTEIKKVCEFIRGTEPGSKSYNTEGIGYRFIRVSDLSKQILEQVFTSEDKNKLIFCNKEDILLALDGVPGVVNKGFEGAISSGIRIVKPKTLNIIKEFLFYILQHRIVQKVIENYTTGTTIKHASRAINFIKIPLPPLPEQQKIAEILSTVDEAIQKTNEVIAKTERLKKGLMQELLTRGIGHKEFKETPIGKIPKDWEVVRLGDKEIAEVIMGQSPPSNTYNDKGEGLPFLQGKLEFGEIYPSPVLYCSNPIKIAEQGDILISVRAPVGDVNIAPYRLCIGRGLAAIRFNSKNANSWFYFYYLQRVKNFLENLGKGSTFKAINKDDLTELKIPLPPLPEQERIVEILSTIDKKLEMERREKARLERIKQGLMDLLLTGKIRVKVD
ncbi:MAG: restriction endonuclease subunit S [Saccharolobus sp.]